MPAASAPPQYCLLNWGRLNAFPINYTSSTLWGSIGGTPIDPARQSILIESLSISDRLNEEANTLIATIRGAKPIEGQPIEIRVGSSNGTPFFLGRMLRTTQVWAADNPKHVLWHVEATDPTWELNAILVTARYRSQSATAIAAQLLAFAPAGFTGAIPAGLPSVDEITMTNVTLMDAFVQLAHRIGGYAFCDYTKVVHLFTGETILSPAPLVASHPSLAGVTYTRDLTQVVTRAHVEGGGANAVGDVAPGSTTLPIEDPAWYSPTGGWVVSGPQRIAYTSVPTTSLGGPSPAPVAAVTPGAGALVGTVSYVITFGTPTGETTPGPVSNPVTVAAVTAPPGTLAAAASGVGPLIGAYYYAVTFVTPLGETTPGPARAITATQQTPPSAPGTSRPGAGPLIGAYQYRVGFVNPYGEALSAPSGSVTCLAQRPSGSPTVTGSPSGSGAMLYWAITWIDDRGYETVLSTNYYSITGGTSHSVTFTGTSSGSSFPPTYVTRWRLYRSTSNRSGSYKLVADTPVNTNFTDSSVPDAELGQLSPTVGTLGERLTVSFATGPSGTTARNVYRTKAGGAPLYYFLGQVPDNTTTSLLDAASDDALSGSPPSQVYAGQQVTLSAIPTGPTGTQARRIYRTLPGDTKFKYLTELSDNTTTTFVDVTPDGSLGSAPPLTNKAGGGKVALSGIPAGGAGITQRLIYRADPDAPATYKYVDTLDNVTATTYTDDGSNAPGQTPPLTSPSSVSLAGIPASGPGSIVWPIKSGDPVNILVIVDDVPAQTALATATGTSGIREALIQDGRIGITEATARGTAYLKAQSRVVETVSHRSRDLNTRSGALVTVDLPPPTDLHGTYRIQDVGISTFHPAAGLPPNFAATSSSSRYTLEDLLRQIANTDPPPTTGETA
jgi:hypothetical protein